MEQLCFPLSLGFLAFNKETQDLQQRERDVSANKQFGHRHMTGIICWQEPHLNSEVAQPLVVGKYQ